MTQPDPARTARFYRQRAARAALGEAGESALAPRRGTAASLAPMTRVYDYYGRLYLERPRELLWAGLARLAGAPIVQGLAGAVRYGIDNAYCHMLVDTCARIFADTAWLHEAFLDDPAVAVALADREERQDGLAPRRRAIWADLGAGDDAGAVAANRRLLEHEQLVVAQAGYDAFRADTSAVSASVRAVHPYHDDFAGDDIGDPKQRWAWVEEMWASWTALPAEECVRLVRLPFDDLRARRFGR